jgi:hypothetical protein
MTSPDFAVKPTLAGDLVILRPFRAGDLPALHAMLVDPEGLILTGSVQDEFAATLPPVEGQDQIFRDWYGGRGDAEDRLDLAVADRGTGECVGEVVLNQWDPVGYGFEQLGLHRIWLEVYAFNPRARRSGRVKLGTRQAILGREYHEGAECCYSCHRPARDALPRTRACKRRTTSHLAGFHVGGFGVAAPFRPTRLGGTALPVW